MTNPAELRVALRSQASADRLRGARALRDDPDVLSLGELRAARYAETDTFVQMALDDVIRLQLEGAPDSRRASGWISVSDDEADTDGMVAQAIEQVSRVVVHEVRTLLMRAKVCAGRDLAGAYDRSSTKLALERLSELLETIQRLEEAARVPQIREFDLTQAVATEVRDMGMTAAQVTLARDDSVVTFGDWSLLALTFRNGLLNAVEATPPDAAPVVVAWGATPSSAWVAVLDEGSGLSDSQAVLVVPGSTSKSKQTHFGWGLTIAERAVRSCRGSLELSSRQPRGTAFEMRWPCGPQGTE